MTLLIVVKDSFLSASGLALVKLLLLLLLARICRRRPEKKNEQLLPSHPALAPLIFAHFFLLAALVNSHNL